MIEIDKHIKATVTIMRLLEEGEILYFAFSTIFFVFRKEKRLVSMNFVSYNNRLYNDP